MKRILLAFVIAATIWFTGIPLSDAQATVADQWAELFGTDEIPQGQGKYCSIQKRCFYDETNVRTALRWELIFGAYQDLPPAYTYPGRFDELISKIQSITVTAKVHKYQLAFHHVFSAPSGGNFLCLAYM